MKYELLIENKNVIYEPNVKEGITWVTQRKGSPSELKFTILKDEIINFVEGNVVSFKIDDKEVFLGYVFTKSRGKEGTIDVTAYDQLRYFKNKDIYKCENLTASEFLKNIIEDYNFKPGIIEQTGYKIESRIEDSTLFDMVQSALDTTILNTKEMYVLYDDFGKITLKNTSSMILDVFIDEETGENFSYSSSIDSNTYNKIQIKYKNEETGETEVMTSLADVESMERWGILQYSDTVEKGENPVEKAKHLLDLYNKKTRTLSIKKAFGDIRVRAGCMVYVMLNLGDMIVQNLMLVETCTHTFEVNNHFMDLKLRGGEFVG